MLLAIREYVKRVEMASLTQIARAFCMDETALFPMIRLLLQKKRLTAIEKDDGCGHCFKGCVKTERSTWFFVEDTRSRG